jgi:Ca2+-binding RTX toxin-like protein
MVSNTISDGNGNDTIYAGNGGDTITAGNGNDQVFGGAGNDTITVGNGNDWVQGGGGCNHISGCGWIYNNTPPGYSAGLTWYQANDPATYVDDVWDSCDGGDIYDANASEQNYGYVIPNGNEQITVDLGRRVPLAMPVLGLVLGQ